VFLPTTGATDVRFRAFLELDVAATEDRLLAANWLAITEEAMTKDNVLLLVYKMRLIEQIENVLKLDQVVGSLLQICETEWIRLL
jgi:hypothetical protein